MPDNASHADIIQDSKQLKAACLEHAAALGDISAELQTLDQGVQKVEELKVQSESLKVARQNISVGMFNALIELRDAGMVLRAVAKSKLGPRSELLVQFGVTPLRLRLRSPRSRKRKGEPTSPPPVEATARTNKKPKDTEAA